MDNKENIYKKGKHSNVKSFVMDGKTVIIKGTFIKIACIKDEFWIEEKIDNPELFIENMKTVKNGADIFTFSKRLTDILPEYGYFKEKYNVAVLEIISHDHWLKKQIDRNVKRNVAKAEKSGVVVRLEDFNDGFVEGITSIYNETPIRQGRRFPHYGKDFKSVKEENSSFLDKSDFIGAYYKEELIGFIKIVYQGKVANLMQILSKMEHRDKCPTNALISKAVEICEKNKSEYLTYGSFVYGNKLDSPLMDFKRRNGFEKIDLPRYYVPLTKIGNIALKFNLQKGISDILPVKVINLFVNVRAKWYSMFTGNNIAKSA